MSVVNRISPYEECRESMALTVNPESREVHLDGTAIELTRTEFDLLSIFHSHPRRVLTPEVLLARLWESDCVPDSHPLEVYVHRLRMKLGESGKSPRFIHNVRGVGYRFEPQPRTAEHRAVLEYDSQAILRFIDSTEGDVWGWQPREIIDTQFVPTRSSVFRNRRLINLLTWMCEAAGIECLTLAPTVTTRQGESIQLRVTLRCRYESQRLTRIQVDAAWFDHDMALRRSSS